MTQLFRRKPIAELTVEGERSLKRVLGAGDLVMLAIGAVIGAGIFGAIARPLPARSTRRHVVRYGAGRRWCSFLLLGGACALAACATPSSPR